MLKIKFILILLFLAVALGLARADDYAYDSKGKRDPFIALITSEGRLMKLDKDEAQNASGININGIIYDKNGLSYAIVNNNVVSIGDYVGDYRVLKVEENKVIFIKGDKILEEVLSKEEKK